MRNYELMLITVPEIGSEGARDLKDRVNEIISREGGRMESFDLWKDKYRMAYTLRSRGAQKRKYDEGTYFLCSYRLDPSKLGSLKYTFDLDERILRFMNVNKGDADGNS